MTLTTFLATWGALLSTFVGAWTLYRDWNDRGKLKIKCYFGTILTEGLPDNLQDKTKYLFYRVTNVGRRTIMVETVGGKEKIKDMNFLIKEHKPTMLKPGEYLHAKLTYSSIPKGIENIEYLFVIDSTGKTWKAKKPVLK